MASISISRINYNNKFHFVIPLAFDVLVREVPVGILPSRLVWKTRMVELPDGEKISEDMCNRLGTIPACDRQTDRQTHRHLATA